MTGLGALGSAGRDGDLHRERLLGVPLEHAARRRHVGVVAADGDADVLLVLLAVVGRVERDPATLVVVDVDPGVRGAVAVRERLVVEVAADVAGRDADVRGRRRSGRARSPGRRPGRARAPRGRVCTDVAPFSYSSRFATVVHQRVGADGVRRRRPGVSSGPSSGRVPRRLQVLVQLEQRRRTRSSTSDERQNLARRRDGQPVVRLEDVEVADGVAEVVAEAVDAHAARLGLEPERDAALAAGRRAAAGAARSYASTIGAS